MIIILKNCLTRFDPDKLKINDSNIPTLSKRSVQRRIIGMAEIRGDIPWEIEKEERRHAEFTYGITPVMRRNTRLKRSEAGWFPRSLFSDARYRGYERAERYREKARPGPRWKAMRNLSEMTSARPSSPAKGLIPEESRIVWGKKREPCCAAPSFFPLPPLYIYICFPSPLFLFFFALHGTLARERPLPMMIFRMKNKWIND